MNRFLIFLMVFLPLSCTPQTQGRIRQKAIENECPSLFTPILSFYVKAYYALPKDKETIISFAEKWKAVDTNFVLFENRYGMSLNDLLSSRIDYAYYTDSAFLFSTVNSNRIGCSIIGSPFYWIMHPEEYNPYKFDFYDQFMPSAFRNNGEYLFEEEFDYDHLSMLINNISLNHSSRIYYDGFYFDGLTETPYRKKMPYMSIVSYCMSTDSITTLTRLLPQDSLFIFNKETESFLQIQNSLTDLCHSYLKDLSLAIKSCQTNNCDVDRIVLGIQWFCDDLEK